MKYNSAFEFFVIILALVIIMVFIAAVLTALGVLPNELQMHKEAIEN